MLVSPVLSAHTGGYGWWSETACVGSPKSTTHQLCGDLGYILISFLFCKMGITTVPVFTAVIRMKLINTYKMLGTVPGRQEGI